ncbi:hypothetical protein CDO44_16250 [Pigmentiphaga sp. NML080357]|nr:hypothetical protein [Pigmentiphaga sp. NML080357]OVZ57928.1 hypothetical protein CDO44_16250 [Pigmentiphaga sp. NML080357]
MNPFHRLPSDEQLDRARSLHESGFTFDFVPIGGPIVMSMRHEAIMRRELARGASLGATLRAMMNDRLAEVDEIPETRRLLADTWRRSGVKTIQATLGGIEVDPCGWDAIVRDLAWYAHAERVSGMLKICRSSAELAHAAAGGVLGVLLGTQDAGWCDSRLERLEAGFHPRRFQAAGAAPHRGIPGRFPGLDGMAAHYRGAAACGVQRGNGARTHRRQLVALHGPPRDGGALMSLARRDRRAEVNRSGCRCRG